MASFEKYYYNLSTIRSQVEAALPCTNHLTVYSSLFREYDSSNLCWYTPVLPTSSDGISLYNSWEKPYSVPMYSNGKQLKFLAKRTYFAPTGSTAGDLWGTYAWSTTSKDYSEIYLLHTSGNNYAICSSIISNPGSYAPNNILKTITPKTDRIAVFLSGGGGGGSAPWGTSNGAGGGGAGTACLILDLSRLKGGSRMYKFVLGAPAGYSGASFKTSGESGNKSYIYDYYRTGNSDNITTIADASGGSGGSTAGGGDNGFACIYAGVDDYVWKIPGISYESYRFDYAHGRGAKGGDGGGTGSAGSSVTWSAYPMYAKNGSLAGDGCKTTMNGGTSGQNISGGGGASYWGNGANGVGKTAAKGARGTNGSGGSGARWTAFGKEGGPGGYSYLRICWTGRTPGAPSAIYPTQLNAPRCSIVSSSTTSDGYIEKKISIQNTNSVPVDVIVQGSKQGVSIQPNESYYITYLTVPSSSGTVSIRLFRVEGDYKASDSVSVSLS